MPFVLFEIFLPLLIAFILGLLIGFLVWRWRRRLLGASEWNALTRAAEAANVERANAEAAVAEVTNERSVLAIEVETLKKRITELEAGR